MNDHRKKITYGVILIIVILAFTQGRLWYQSAFHLAFRIFDKLAYDCSEQKTNLAFHYHKGWFGVYKYGHLDDCLRIVTKIEGVDKLTFQVLNDRYTKDVHHVYFYQVVPEVSANSVADADPKTFRALGNNYGVDTNYVFYAGQIIPVADPETFRLEHGKAFDKNYEYQGARKLKKDE